MLIALIFGVSGNSLKLRGILALVFQTVLSAILFHLVFVDMRNVTITRNYNKYFISERVKDSKDRISSISFAIFFFCLNMTHLLLLCALSGLCIDLYA